MLCCPSLSHTHTHTHTNSYRVWHTHTHTLKKDTHTHTSRDRESSTKVNRRRSTLARVTAPSQHTFNSKRMMCITGRGRRDECSSARLVSSSDGRRLTDPSWRAALVYTNARESNQKGAYIPYTPTNNWGRRRARNGGGNKQKQNKKIRGERKRVKRIR